MVGIYLYGIFDLEEFINLFVNFFKEKNNILVLEEDIIIKVNEYKDNEYDRLVKVFEENI